MAKSHNRSVTTTKNKLPKDKKRLGKTLRNTFIGTIVLIVIFLASGFFYTWYIGQKNENKAEPALKLTNNTNNLITPRKPAADAVVGVAIHMLTSPVVAGQEASISIKTNADANCIITAAYNDKKIYSKDPGLVPQKADDYGVASWTWTVDETAPKGKWPVEVTCSNIAKSGFVRGDLVVR